MIAAELILLVLWVRLVVVFALGIFALTRRRAQDKGAAVSGTVSVVVPAFNEAETIEATLAALLRQDPPPFEIIVVNDGSSDATAELARQRLAGVARARVIELPLNCGKAEALNAGIRSAGGAFIATIDADTLLLPGALSAALAALLVRDAGGVAFYLDVANADTILGQLQRQEYVSALNFERAGQDTIGAISILPGAASLYRRELLIAHPFSGRTRTEDADLTLTLSARGIRAALAPEAMATTLVPATVAGLYAQRVRWTAGHLQCCRTHWMPVPPAAWRFRWLVFPNFVASTLLAAGGLAALLAIMAIGPTGLLAMDWRTATLISILLTYAQRGGVRMLDRSRRVPLHVLLMEPMATNLVNLSGLVGAVGSLALAAVYRGRGCRSGSAQRGE